jgi:hypothetical protein
MATNVPMAAIAVLYAFTRPLSGRSAESLLPIRLDRIVDPHLNRACVKAIVVVVAAAVLAAVADVGYESLGCAARPRIQENATA